MGIFRAHIKLILLIGTFVFLPLDIYAQNKELLSLLEEYPEEQNSTQLAVYTPSAKKLIAKVNEDATYQTIERQGAWQVIQFDQPIIPLWVSSDYVNQIGDEAVITTNNLNIRLEPQLGSAVMGKATIGYRSPVLASDNGFVKIKAPTSVRFAIKSAVTPSLDSQSSVSPSTDQQVAKAKTPQSSNNTQALVKKTLPAESLNASQSHILAPGDSISLLVFGEPDLSVENVRIPETGFVSFPLIGSVEVAGKTTKIVEERVRNILSSGYVKNPKLSVSIFSYRPIFIRGAIKNTGAFPFTEGLSIAKAIAIAGGAKQSARENGVSILRNGQLIESDLSLDSQYQIASGDVVSVDEELGASDDAQLFIYLHGEVANPGEYRYRSGLTVEKAIVLAGGFTLRASRKRVKVTRYDGVDENKEPVKLKGVKLYTTVEPGDVINVGASWF